MEEESKMKQHRIAVAALAALSIGALGACHHARELTDAQLTQLLHMQAASPTDPNAPLDPMAVNCLRAWSGDAELTAALPPSAQNMKDACKPRLEGWIADATRNPDKITFAEASSPPSVRRAMALLAAHRGTAMRMPNGQDRPPAALMSPNPAGPNAQAPAQPGPPPDLTAATDAVNQLDGYCQKAKQAAAAGNTEQPIARYASYCDKRIEQLRMRISSLQQNGTPQQVQMLTTNVQRTLQMAQQIEARQNQPATPTKN
jgi:hypothetical protein